MHFNSEKSPEFLCSYFLLKVSNGVVKSLNAHTKLSKSGLDIAVGQLISGFAIISTSVPNFEGRSIKFSEPFRL